MIKKPVRSGALALGLLASAPASAADHLRASWYGAGHERLNKRTASGEVFRPNSFTAAHRSLPFGARLRVCREQRCVVVRINDRGPNIRTGRSLDLSRAAASSIGLTRIGVGPVSIERL